MARRPTPAPSSRVFPPLAVFVAGGSLAASCQAPTCAPSRAGELALHGQRASEALGHGLDREGLRELCLGVGLLAHPPSADPQPSGSVRVVTELPANPPPPMPVTLPTNAGESSGHVQAPGRMRVVHPDPSAPPPPPAPPPTIYHPPQRTTLGHRARVTP